MTTEVHAILEAWKQSLAAKQHFDELAFKIRGLFLTLLTGMLGVSQVLATPDNRRGFVVAIYLIWAAFYLMDRWWYHYLLLGAVRHASSLEGRAAAVGLRLPPVVFSDPVGKARHGKPRDRKRRFEDNIESHNSILGLTYRISTMQQSSMFGIKAQYKLDAYYLLILAGLTAFIACR